MEKKYYAYLGTEPLGSEPLGTEGRLLFERSGEFRGMTLDTRAVRYVRKLVGWGSRSFTLYSYTNFYDNSTFTLVHQQIQDPE